MSIFSYYFQVIFLANYVSGKIEGHVPSQSTAAKNWGHVPPRLPGAPMIKPPSFERLTSPMSTGEVHNKFTQSVVKYWLPMVLSSNTSQTSVISLTSEISSTWLLVMNKVRHVPSGNSQLYNIYRSCSGLLLIFNFYDCKWSLYNPAEAFATAPVWKSAQTCELKWNSLYFVWVLI